MRHGHDAGEHRHRPTQRRPRRGGGRTRVVLHGDWGFHHEERRGGRGGAVPAAGAAAVDTQPGRVGRGRRLAQVHHQRPAEERVRRDHRREPFLLRPEPRVYRERLLPVHRGRLAFERRGVRLIRPGVRRRAGWRGGRDASRDAERLLGARGHRSGGQAVPHAGLTLSVTHAELQSHHPPGERRG